VFSCKSLNGEQVTQEFESELKAVEHLWLTDGNFIGGAEEISIADISAFCELEQLQRIDFDFSGYPRIVAWQKKIKDIEEIKVAHENFYKILAALAAMKKKETESA